MLLLIFLEMILTFDFQNLLMKQTLFLAASCFLIFSAKAQQDKIEITPLPQFQMPKDSIEKFLQRLHSTIARARLSHVLPNGNSVYILPLDNMPCVVPKTVAIMPVLGGTPNGNMPNLAPVLPLIPKKN
jgi:hypothetical protein